MERHAIIRAVTKGAARVVVLLAPSGFGKSTVARQIAPRYPEHGMCDCAGVSSVRQLATKLLAAFKEMEPFRAQVLAQNGIALARDNNDDGDLLALALHTFERISVRSLLIIENVEQIKRPDVAKALEELLRIKNPSCTVLLCSRPPTPLRYSQVVPPNELITMGARELRFTDDEIRQVLGYYNVPAKTIAEVAQQTMRWPSALSLAESMLRTERLSDVLPRLGASLRDRHQQIVEEIIEGLEPHLLDVLLAVAGLRNANLDDIERVGAGAAAEAVHQIEERLPLLVHDRARNTVQPHKWLLHTILPKYAERSRAITLQIAASYERSGEFVSAARAYLSAGDRESAASCLERAPLQTFSTPPVMEMVVDLGARVLAEHPQLWYAAVPYRRFAIDPGTLLAEARELFAKRMELPQQLRWGIVFLNALLALDAGDRDHVETTRRWFSQHAPESVDARAFELMYNGTLFGRWDDSLYELVLAQCTSPALQGLLEGWRATCLALRGRFHSAAESLDSALTLVKRSQGILRASRVRSQMHFLTWLQGDDALADRLVGEIEDHLLPYQQHAFRAYTTAIRERSIDGLSETMTPHWRASAALVVAGYTQNPERAMLAARFALEQADASLDTFTRVLTRLALALLMGTDGAAYLREASQLAKHVDAPLLQADIEALQRGSADDVQLLKAFVRRFGRHIGGRIVVDLFSQRAWCGTREIRLSDRVRELLLTLALNEGSMRTSDLQTLLWPTLPAEKANNALKAAVHRLRTQIGQGDIVQPSGNTYLLSAQVAVEDSELLTALSHVERLRVVDDARASGLSAAAAILSDRVMHRHRRRYAGLQRRIASALALHAIQGTKYGLARKYATMMLELDPYDERAYALVITAFTRSGDAASANSMYMAYRHAMAEAGLESNAAIEDLLIPQARPA